MPQRKPVSGTVFTLKTEVEVFSKKLKVKFVNLKTAFDKVDPKSFFVELDELYKIPSGVTSLPPFYQKIFTKLLFTQNLKIDFFSTFFKP